MVRSKTAGLEPHTEFLWRREDYEEVVRAGIFSNEDRLELLNGKIIAMAPQYAPHTLSCELVGDYLRRVYTTGYRVRLQFPFALDVGSEPEPDIAVVRGEARDYSTQHPAAADTLLVVEVADSSLAYDRGEKLAAYARAGIPEYWIVNLVDRVVEVYRDPEGENYSEVKMVGPAELVAPMGKEDQGIRVAELLP